MNDTADEQVDDISSRLKQGLLSATKKTLWVDKERHIKRYMKGSVRIYLRSKDCRSCGRGVGAKINIWVQNRKHDMPSTQLREMQKRRSLLMLNTIKKTSLVLPNKCVQKIRM